MDGIMAKIDLRTDHFLLPDISKLDSDFALILDQGEVYTWMDIMQFMSSLGYDYLINPNPKGMVFLAMYRSDKCIAAIPFEMVTSTLLTEIVMATIRHHLEPESHKASVITELITQPLWLN
jgi:hypothetical protein